MANGSMRDELIVNFVWQWDNNVQSCLDALGAPANIISIDALKAGQSHNPDVVDLYQAGFTVFGPFDFFKILCEASWSTGNMDEVRLNLDWQFENNPQSIADCWNYWSIYQGAGKQDFSYLFACRSIVSGQRHNPPVMAVYRANIRDHQAEFFTEVGKRISKP
jgi:hypothetical protein